ncbi:MFS transporter [candidate division KSB1 bacterium]|nr:MFS transporter [candidate division KSB1 bacterium]
MTEHSLEAGQSELRQFLGRNYLVHSIEGGLYIGGLAFIAANTVLPRMVEILHGPAWVVSLMPIMMALGFGFPPILTAHRIEKLQRMKPIVMVTGVFQRLPFLFAALGLMMLTEQYRILALIIAVFAPFISGAVGGLSVTAWQELIIKTIPTNRRSSLFATRLIISTSIGLAAGGTIAAILDDYPGTYGYGILFLIAFGFSVISYAIFSLVRETNFPMRNMLSKVNLRENLRKMPGIIKQDRQFRYFLVSRTLINGIFIVMPFMAIHALRVLEKPDSFLGNLVAAQMAGGIIGNIIAGVLGDRSGGKIVMRLSTMLFILVSVWSAVANTEWVFMAIFFLFGTAAYANDIGIVTLTLEICPVEKRSTYLALIAFVNLPVQLGCSLVSAVAWTLTQNLPLLSLFTIVFLVLSTIFLAQLQEPRKNPVLR